MPKAEALLVQAHSIANLEPSADNSAQRKIKSGKLGYTKSECEKLLKDRIQEARSLMATVELDGAHFNEEYQKFTVEITGWREINCDILKKMFPDPSIAKKI